MPTPHPRQTQSLPDEKSLQKGGAEAGLDRTCPSWSIALSEAAEVYFSAIQKIGERALQSPTSQILGEAPPPWQTPFSGPPFAPLPFQDAPRP